MGEECGVTHQLQKQNHRLTGGSTVHTINIEIRATVPVSPEIPTSVFVISLHLVGLCAHTGRKRQGVYRRAGSETRTDCKMATAATIVATSMTACEDLDSHRTKPRSQDVRVRVRSHGWLFVPRPNARNSCHTVSSHATYSSHCADAFSSAALVRNTLINAEKFPVRQLLMAKFLQMLAVDSSSSL